ncbi:MAG: O-antigen ligase family protein [Solirubrobacteraceae bacterium]
MIAFAALNGPLPKAGVVAVTLLAAAVLLVPDRRLRAGAMLGALVLASVLLLADIWGTPRLAVVHRHPLPALVGGMVVIALLVAGARLVARRPAVLAPLVVLALPFRVPIQAGSSTSNLLVPLYLVVALGALAWIGTALAPRWFGAPAPMQPTAEVPRAGGGRLTELLPWVQRLLALYIALYGAQAAYSPDFVKALQNVVFFYVPFALLYALLRELDWDAPMIRRCLTLAAGLAIVFSLIGFYEYATKTILLNPRLDAANEVHTYFTVNSVFFDPDIFGRYLALVMILLAVGLIYVRPEREQALSTIVLAVLWACLVLTLSRSSLGALLVGLAVLAALRWRPSRALVVAVVVVGLGAGAVVALPRTFGLNQGLNGASRGRGGLVSGGLSLFGDRPLWGYGSGSFSTEYIAHNRQSVSALSDSHTIPVTIAAEQGLIGEVAYVAFVLAAVACLALRSRGDPVRSAIAAAFIALVFDTMLYADFLEDPTTWVLLGAGMALAGRRAGVDRQAQQQRVQVGPLAG